MARELSLVEMPEPRGGGWRREVERGSVRHEEDEDEKENAVKEGT